MTIKAKQGFSLIEMLLVLAIVSTLVVLGLNYSTQKADQTRRDVTVQRTQMILNTALAYFMNTGKWPTGVMNNDVLQCADPAEWGGLDVLLSANYIMPTDVKTPYGTPIEASCGSKAGNFYVSFRAKSAADAAAIAGQLPLAFINSSLPGFDKDSNPQQEEACQHTYEAGYPNCVYVISSVPPPGQNLNNARSVNFSNIYSSGQCVPEPTCPDGMTGQIFVVPVAVNGAYDAANPTNVSPISGFTAYAMGPYVPPSVNGCPNQKSDTCATYIQNGNFSAGQRFWRICLAVTTDKGDVNPSGGETATEAMGSILAITRCAPDNEKTGSTFQVYN